MTSLQPNEVISIELLTKNETQDNIEARIVRDFGNSPLLEDPSNLYLSISRFVIPLTSLELIRLHDTLDYYIEMSVPFQNTQGDNSTSQKTGISYFFPRTVQKIYTPDQYLAQINRSMYESYVNLCSDISPNLFKKTIPNAFLFDIVSSENVISTGSMSGTNTLYTSLKLSNFQSNISSDNPIVSIYLINPANQKTLVCGAVKLESNKTYIFNDLCPGISNHLSILDINYNNNTASYKPTEFFYSKFYNSTAQGNWKIQIVPSSNNDIDFSMDVELTVQNAPYVLDRYDYSPLFPSYSLDKTSGYLSINLPEKFVKSGIIIKPSPKLLSLLSLEKVATSENIYLEQRPLTHIGNPIITIQAAVPKLYLMCEVYQILLQSDNLPISRDLTETGNVYSNAISSFIVSSDEVLNFSQAIYSDADQYKLRRYKFKQSSQRLTNMNVYFSAKYNDGEIVRMELLPNESVSILLHIFNM